MGAFYRAAGNPKRLALYVANNYSMKYKKHSNLPVGAQSSLLTSRAAAWNCLKKQPGVPINLTDRLFTYPRS
jgi:hypothetical protein